MPKKRFIAGLSLVISSLVVLSSLHAAQVLGAAVKTDDVKKPLPQDEGIAKAMSDHLHNHTDKAGVKLIKDTGHKHFATDGRSLRQLQQQRKDQPYLDRLLDKMRQWWRMSTLFLA